MRYGRPHVLVRWAGRDASGETWEPLENLTNCDEAIRDFERSSGVVLPRQPEPPAPPSAAIGGVAPPRPTGEVDGAQALLDAVVDLAPPQPPP